MSGGSVIRSAAPPASSAFTARNVARCWVSTPMTLARVVGVSNTGAAVVDGQLGGLGFDNNRRRDDFAVVRAGLNFKFGSLFGAY